LAPILEEIVSKYRSSYFRIWRWNKKRKKYLHSYGRKTKHSGISRKSRLYIFQFIYCLYIISQRIFTIISNKSDLKPVSRLAASFFLDKFQREEVRDVRS